MNDQISLSNIIDMHVHTAPDIISRSYNDLQLTDVAVRSGARAVVIKGHHCSTVARAALCNIYNKNVHGNNSFIMYGGLVLNREVGGLNPQAVKTALQMGAKVIWLPTTDSANEYHMRDKIGGISILDKKGDPLPELYSIFRLICDYDAVLATGHISAEEIFRIADAARNFGVKKIVITHPEYWIVDLKAAQQKKLLDDYNIIFERCLCQPLKDGQWISNAAHNLDAIRKLGSSSTILSTDCGNTATLPWEQSIKKYIQFMKENGINDEMIIQMTQKTPGWLLGL